MIKNLYTKNLKVIFAQILSIIYICMLPAVQAGSLPALAIETVSGYVGQTIKLDVGFTREQSMSAIMLEINYDSAQFIASKAKTSFNKALGGRSEEVVALNTDIPGKVYALYAGEEAVEIGSSLLTIAFEIKAGARIGSYNITIENIQFIDGSGVETDVEYENGVIKILKSDSSPTNRVGGKGIGAYLPSAGAATATPDPVESPAVSSPPDENPPESKPVFTDVDENSWAKESIEALAVIGVINGMIDENGERYFSPDDIVTREQFIRMLMATFGMIDDDVTTDLTDVEKDSWYYGAVASAQALGIIKGYPDGSFGIGEAISRQDMAVLTYRVINYVNMSLPEVNEPNIFDDARDIEAYASEAVSQMQRSGIINGVGDNRFAPFESTTRAMAAKIIYSLIKLAQ